MNYSYTYELEQLFQQMPHIISYVMSGGIVLFIASLARDKETDQDTHQ